MKLCRVAIHNYRGILEVSFHAYEYSLLVGANNHGKSAVMSAIRAFYEKDGAKFKDEVDWPFVPTVDQESWTELTYELTDAEDKDLKDEYRNPERRLCLRKYFRTGESSKDGKSRAGMIHAYRTDGSIADESFYGAKNVQSGKIGDLIFIPAVSKVDEHTKLTGPSALRDLLSDLMSSVVEGSSAYGALSAAIDTFAKEVRTEESPDKRSLKGLEDELTDMLSSWRTEFKLDFPPIQPGEMVKSMLDWTLTDQAHGHTVNADVCGSGFQRHFIYSLLRLAARYQPKKVTSKSKDFTPSLTLMLFEEPEAFLHPPQQDALARSLVDAARNGVWQVLCSTHSSHFVSRNADSIPSIVRMQRTNGAMSAYQVDQNTWTGIVSANQVINAIAQKWPKMKAKLASDDTKPDMEAVKHFMWLNPDRASAFFADRVLLVEGPTEVGLINKLIGDGRIKVPEKGVYVLDCLGKYNIHRFANLFSALGVSHSILYDEDGNVDEHGDINAHLQSYVGSQHTAAVVALSGDIESYLGIKPASAPHRKPQHVLYQLETGKIDAGKLVAFCKLVEGCM